MFFTMLLGSLVLAILGCDLEEQSLKCKHFDDCTSLPIFLNITKVIFSEEVFFPGFTVFECLKDKFPSLEVSWMDIIGLNIFKTLNF
jgi:hypothetical protein